KEINFRPEDVVAVKSTGLQSTGNTGEYVVLRKCPAESAARLRVSEKHFVADHALMMNKEPWFRHLKPEDWCQHLGVITDAGNAVEGIKAVVTGNNRSHFTLPLVQTGTRCIAGYVHAAYSSEEQELSIAHVKVDEEHMGQGLGGMLIDAAEQHSERCLAASEETITFLDPAFALAGNVGTRSGEKMLRESGVPHRIWQRCQLGQKDAAYMVGMADSSFPAPGWEDSLFPGAGSRSRRRVSLPAPALLPAPAEAFLLSQCGVATAANALGVACVSLLRGVPSAGSTVKYGKGRFACYKPCDQTIVFFAAARPVGQDAEALALCKMLVERGIDGIDINHGDVAWSNLEVKLQGQWPSWNPVPTYVKGVQEMHEGRETKLLPIQLGRRPSSSKPGAFKHAIPNSRKLQSLAGFRPLHVASSAAVACDRFVLVSGYPGTKELDQTALFYAARQGHANTIRYLISKGANPNVVDKNGETAQLGCWMFFAVLNKRTAAVKALLEGGAEFDDPERKTGRQERKKRRSYDESGMLPFTSCPGPKRRRTAVEELRAWADEWPIK
ncbi:unnamed protein product, partial [Cladocopium goreaui]